MPFPSAGGSGSAGRPGYTHAGLLILRLGIGAIFVIHGYPKLMAGPEGWEKLGGAISVFGITFLPVAWGFMAAFSECICGFLLAIGVFTRISAFFILCTMVVATARHLQAGDGFNGYSHALALAVVVLALMITGGGQLSFGHIIMPLRDKWYE